MSEYNIWDNPDDGDLSPGKSLNVADIAVDIPPEHKTILFYFIVVLYIIMVLACLVLNSFFAFVLAKGVQSYKKPFFRIVWQLVLANIISSLSNIITTFPPTFLMSTEGSKKYHDLVFYKIVDFLDNMADQLVMFMCLVIAAHRLFIFVFPRICETVFTGFAIILHQVIYECSYQWKYSQEQETRDGRDGYFQFACSAIKYKPNDAMIEIAFMVQVILFPVICVLFYLVIYIRISSQRERTSLNTNRTEKEIMKQAAVLFTAFQISSIVSYASLSISTKDAHAYLARRIVNTVELFAGTLTPLLFFITSKELREGIGRSKPGWWYSLKRSYSNTNKVLPVVRGKSKESFRTKTAVSTM